MIPVAVVTLVESQTLRCKIDVSAVPSLKLAIAMLEQAVRELKNEETNQAAVQFGARLMKEEGEARVVSALANPRKQ